MVNGVWRPATGPNMDAALMEAIERIVIDDDLSAFAAGLDAIREGNA